jgi:hypothetical protein
MDMTRSMMPFANLPIHFGEKLYPMQHIYLTELIEHQNNLHPTNVGQT